MPQDAQASIAGEKPAIITVSQNGWSPVLALVDRTNDDLTTSTVFQVVNWVGGIAKKPTTGAYVGEDGLVLDIDDAVDVKGGSGTIQTTLAMLRLLVAPDSSTFYVTDLDGIFTVDATDTETEDDGVFTIVTANDKRFKKKSYGNTLSISSVDDFPKIDNKNSNSILLDDLNRGGIFKWFETGYTEDSGIVFIGKTGYWVRQFYGCVDVRWYGAIGNGIADDTLAINNAIETGIDVSFDKDGIYKCTTLVADNDNQTLFLNGGTINLTQAVFDANNLTVDLGGGSINGSLRVGKLVSQANVGQNQLNFVDASQFSVGDLVWCSYGDNVSNFPLDTPTAISSISGNVVTLASSLDGTVPIPAGIYIGTFEFGVMIDIKDSKNLRIINGSITNSKGYFLHSWRWNMPDFATNIPSVKCENINFDRAGLDQFLFVKTKAKFVDCTFGITYDVAKQGFVYGNDAEIELIRCTIARGNFDYDFTPLSDEARSTLFDNTTGRITAENCVFNGLNKLPSAPYFSGNSLHSFIIGSGGANHPSGAKLPNISFKNCQWINYGRSAISTTSIEEAYAVTINSISVDSCLFDVPPYQIKALQPMTIYNFSFNSSTFITDSDYEFTQTQNANFVSKFNSCSIKDTGSLPQFTDSEFNNCIIYDTDIKASSTAKFNNVILKDSTISTDSIFGYSQFSGSFIIDNSNFAGQSANLTDMGIMSLQDGQGSGISVRSANGSIWYDVAAFSGKAYIIANLNVKWFDNRFGGLYGDDWNLGITQNIVGFGHQIKATYSLASALSAGASSGASSISVTSVSTPGNRPASDDYVTIQLTNGDVFVTTIASGYVDGNLTIPLDDVLPSAASISANVWFFRIVEL